MSEIKIDRSFVTNLASAGDDVTIVRSTIDLAHNLGLKVVAEGVEHEDVAKQLVEYRCDIAQGFHVGRPAPADDLLALLSKSRSELPGAGTERAQPVPVLEPAGAQAEALQGVAGGVRS